MELILDAENKCFLCLQCAPTDASGLTEFNLRNICRFLKINTSAILLKALKDTEKDASNLLQDKKCNFAVHLCDRCRRVAEKLSCLIRELDVMQLQVNYYSQLFRSILERGDLENKRENEDPSLSVDARVIVSLRKIAEKECTNLNHVFETYKMPVVKLTRLTEDPKENLPRKGTLAGDSHKCDSDADHCEDEFENLSQFETIKATEVGAMENNWENDPGVEAPPKSSGSLLTCNYCLERVNMADMTHHLADNHLHNHFSFLKRPHVSNEMFPKICQAAVDRELERWKIFQNRTGEGDLAPTLPPTPCHICAKAIGDDRYLKKHLMSHHADILQETIQSLQDGDTIAPTPNNDNDLPNTEMCVPLSVPPLQFSPRETPAEMGDATDKAADVGNTGSNSLNAYLTFDAATGHHKCTLCGEIVSGSRSKIGSHVILHHPERMLSHAKTSQVSEQTFTTLCLDTIAKAVDQCTKSVLGTERQKTSPDDNLTYSCYLCNRVFVNRRYLQEHIVTKHSRSLTVELRKLQKKLGNRVSLQNSGSSSPGGDGEVSMVNSGEQMECLSLATTEAPPDIGRLQDKDRRETRNMGGSESTGGTLENSSTLYPEVGVSPVIPLISVDIGPAGVTLSLLPSSHVENECSFREEPSECIAMETVFPSTAPFPISHLISPSFPSCSGYQSPRVGDNAERGTPTPNSCGPATPANMEQILNDTVQRHCSRLELPSGSHYNCHLCGKRTKLRIKFHLTTVHAETLFSFAKLPPVQEADFKQFFFHVLQIEIRQCTSLSGDTGNVHPATKGPYVCYLCSKRSHDRRLLRHHLIVRHADVLAERLCALQSKGEGGRPSTEDPGGQSGETGILPSKADNLSRGLSEARENPAILGEPPQEREAGSVSSKPRGFAKAKRSKTGPGTNLEKRRGSLLHVCEDCNERWGRYDKLRIHRIRYHPDQLFLSYRPPHRSPEEFRKSCQQVLKREAQSRKCSGRGVSEVPQRCAYCAATHRYRTDYLVHLVTIHKDIVGGKIARLENPPIERGKAGVDPGFVAAAALERREDGQTTEAREEDLQGDPTFKRECCRENFANYWTGTVFPDNFSLEEESLSLNAEGEYITGDMEYQEFFDAAGPLEKREFMSWQ